MGKGTTHVGEQALNSDDEDSLCRSKDSRLGLGVLCSNPSKTEDKELSDAILHIQIGRELTLPNQPLMLIAFLSLPSREPFFLCLDTSRALSQPKTCTVRACGASDHI